MIDKYLNQIICGDCLEVMQGMPDKCVDLVLTDPPYGMNYQCGFRKIKSIKIKNDNTLTWLIPFATECFRVLKDNTHLYLFCNDYAISDFRKTFELVGFKPKRALVWIKNQITMGDLEGDYGNSTEFLLFFHKGRKKLNGNRTDNILRFNKVSCDLHPTTKPVPMFEYLINKSSELNQTILDPFLGSGTTAIAAKQTDRQFIGIELSPEYCEIARQRLAKTYYNEEMF